jgi:tRNA A-37 threonylcarbamoyl transferase component Bud32/tetratricopeptide (TPR) repeat protein
MTDSLSTCPDCGATLPPDSPQALCPACLMRQALASRTIVDGDHPASASPPLTPEELGEKFPGYEILQCLGRGGMGVVYKARQKSLNRIVAIKILAPERGSESRFAERFAREAELLARLNHPHIVTIHDFGETGGLFYLVMEFVDGVNLRDLLRDGKLEPKQALAIVPPICDALQYAHDKGIVHRDIKPENLLLDRDGRIKIADFGIASLMGAAGEIAGTPPYMAPEQTGGDIDHRADIYALGVVLYEMLTGERPDKEVIAPSRKVQIDVRLDEMVLRALEQDPERRYQTAGEFKTLVETMKPAPAVNPPAPVRPPGTSGEKSAPNGAPAGMWALGLFIGAVVGFPLLWGIMGAQEVVVICGMALLLSFVLGLMSWRTRSGRFSAIASGVGLLLLVAFTFNYLTPRPTRGPSEGGGKITSYTPVKDAKLLAALSARYGTDESRFELGKPFDVDLLFLNHSPIDMVLNPQELPPTAWLTVTDSAGNPVKLTGTNEAASVLKEPRVLKSRDGTSGYSMSLLLRPKDDTAITPKAKADAMAWVEPGIYTLQFHLRLPVTGYPSEGSSEYHYHSTPLPIEIAGPPTKKTASKAPVSFGPVIERQIPRLAAEKACLLDLDTGEFHTPPADLVEQLKLNTTEKTDLKKSSLKWLRESGVDIAASPDSNTLYVIGSLTKGHHHPFNFDDMPPDFVADTFSKPSSIPKQKSDIYSAILPADLGPMVFITSEGTKGVMEIPSGTNDPAGVKIRYKLLRGSNPSSEAMAAAKAVLDLPPLEPVKELKIPQQDFPEGTGRMGYRLTVAPGKGAYVLATLREFEGSEVIREKTPAKRQVARLLRTQSAAHSEDVFLDSHRDDVQTRTVASSRFAVSGFGQQVVITGLDFSGGGGSSVGGEKPVAVTRRFKFTDPGGDKARMRIVEFALRVLNEDDTAALAKRHGFSLPDENVDNWAITLAEPPAEPAAPDASAVDGPWGDHFKEGEIRRAQNGLADALVSYRLSLEVAQNEMKQRPQDAAWHAYSQRRIKKSYTRIGDVLYAQGDLAGALENYRAGLAGFEPLVRKEAADEELRNELTALYVKIGDVLEAQGDNKGALAAFRKAQEVHFPDFRTWEESFIKSIGGSYNPTIPFNPEELKQLAANPKSEADFRRLARLINRAGAEKDGSFQYLLEKPELRKDEEVNLALIAYDYSVNGNPKALDELLARLAREMTGSDSSVAATLAFVDEWDRVPKAMDAHFAGADGSGGDLQGFCKAWTAYLFPRHSLQYEGKAGEGAPVKPR